MDLFVSIRCPQCGADISFEEESTVIYCEFCGSALCLTGRSGVVRTYVPPRKDVVRMKKALKGAMKGIDSTAQDKVLISEKKLYFAPYWRVKAMVFRWIFGKNFQGRLVKELKTKSLDQTFPAYRGMHLGLRSLGIRPEALTLRFFDEEKMSSQGAIMKVTVPYKEAVEHSQKLSHVGLDEMDVRIHMDRTRMVGERYSMIYFPFWMVRLTAGGTSRVLIIDGLANTVTRSLSLEEWSGMVREAEKTPASVSFNRVSFIPFKCPNCGWDLPLNRFNMVHICPTCHRAWIQSKGRFRGVAFEVAAPPEDTVPPFVYLPFWTFSVDISCGGEILNTARGLIDFSGMFPTRVPQDTDESPLQFYLPAVEIRNITAACKLAAEVTQKQPSLTFVPKDFLLDASSLGAFLAPRATKKLAEVLLFAMTPKGNLKRQDFVRDAHIAMGKLKLVWWPFLEQRLFLRDTICGCGIQKGTVLPSHPVSGGGTMHTQGVPLGRR